MDAISLCQQNYETIITNKAKYVYNTNIEEEIEFVVNKIKKENQDGSSKIPKDGAIIDENLDGVAPEYEILNDRLDEGDIGVDVGHRISTLISNSITKFKIPEKMVDSEYYDLMKSLNDKQRRYILQVLHCVKTKVNLPFYNMILGSAGVGKSRLIHAIYQTLYHHYFEEKDYDPESFYILKVCYTAQAALNIHGLTIHKALHINPSQSGRLNILNASQLNSLRAKLYKLKFILIDEISMVGSKLFSYMYR